MTNKVDNIQVAIKRCESTEAEIILGVRLAYLETIQLILHTVKTKLRNWQEKIDRLH